MRSNRSILNHLICHLTRAGTAVGLALVAITVLAAASPAAAQPARTSPQPSAPADRELLVLNKSKRTVNELYVSPSNADQWGDDRLGDDTIDPGKSYRAKLGRTRDCEFDVQVVYDDASHEESRRLNLCRVRQVAFDGTNAIAAPKVAGAEHQVTFVNQSARPIQQLFISPAESTQWGDDRLSDGSISVGDSSTIPYRGECSADLRVIFDNKGAEERRGVDICQTPSILIQPGWTTADATLTPTAPTGGATAPPPPSVPPPAPALRRTETVPPASPARAITVSNHSGHGATELYLFPDGSANYGRDRLGLNTLADGGKVTLPVDAAAGCKLAAHVVFDGRAPDTDMTGLDICKSPEIVLSGH